ncbi:MAG: aldo/keto reductase [Geminicoccaceae bacterium]
MKTTIPTITLNNGIELPTIGLGVYRSSPEETVQAVRAALAAGYPMIDTAAAYGNEAEVGEGIRSSGTGRADVFLQTKLWISDYGFDSALHAFDRSTRKLGYETVDLYLLHQPMPDEFERTIAAWKAAERLLADGRARAIGVSNFSPAHLDRLLAGSAIVPAVNQVEVHPFFTQKPLSAVHEKLAITTQAWSPIGGVNRYYTQDPRPEDDPLRHPVITALAEKYGRTPAQIVLRWGIELGHSVIPKSVSPARIIENAGIFDFALSPQEIASIDALDTGRRGGPEPDSINTTAFPFRVED